MAKPYIEDLEIERHDALQDMHDNPGNPDCRDRFVDAENNLIDFWSEHCGEQARPYLDKVDRGDD